MYENGRQLNRYAAKMIHKKRQKRNYTRNFLGGFRCKSWEDYVAHANKRDDLRYWRQWYLSNVRRFASEYSNSVIRSQFRTEKQCDNYEEMYAPQYSHYKKYFDYWWTVM